MNDIRCCGRRVDRETDQPPVFGKDDVFSSCKAFQNGKLFIFSEVIFLRRLHTRITAFLLCAVLLVFCACSGGENKEPIPPERAVTDGSGAVLEIPESGTDITIASVYAVSVPFIVALGLSDNVAAINCKSYFWTDNVQALADAGTVGRGVVDLEALAGYRPYVFIHRANDSKTVDAVKELGIDVLCIKAESMEDVIFTLRMMGRYFGSEERAEEVIAYINEKFEYIDSITAKIPEEERVTAITMGGEYGRIAGEDMIQSWMIEKAGGICGAKDITNDCNWSQIGTERLFELNPDYLFLTSSTTLDYTREEIMSDSAWSAMESVKNDRVRQIPARIDSWDMPGVVSVIGTMWMLNQMYPEYFTTEQLQQEIDEYYTLMFGRTFDAEYLGYEL